MEVYEKFKTYKSAMWLIIVALYLLVSFGTGMWHISWIIFIIGAAIEQVVKVFFLRDLDAEQPGNNNERRKKAFTSAMWLVIVAAYIIISFATGAWYVTWVIFLIGAALEPIIRVHIK